MSDLIIVTVSGVDNVGIVARITATMEKYTVNIEDIKQTLMQGHFVMFMLCDISKSNYSFKEIKEALTKCGNDMGMEVWIQKKEIVDNMHKI
ncbi:MAG: ACT domain-containing protein [Muribaculaceae bacterium]|nr:ACT domain-containing protein [Muribaculaceae bacterium]